MVDTQKPKRHTRKHDDGTHDRLFNVHVCAVDNSGCYIYQCATAEHALNYLKNIDHEGSSVSVQIQFNDPDEVYFILEELREHKEQE